AGRPCATASAGCPTAGWPQGKAPRARCPAPARPGTSKMRLPAAFVTNDQIGWGVWRGSVSWIRVWRARCMREEGRVRRRCRMLSGRAEAFKLPDPERKVVGCECGVCDGRHGRRQKI
ncbi:hypothetical protein B5P40_32065, partial [Bacillus sp. SRB_8]